MFMISSTQRSCVGSVSIASPSKSYSASDASCFLCSQACDFLVGACKGTTVVRKDHQPEDSRRTTRSLSQLQMIGKIMVRLQSSCNGVVAQKHQLQARGKDLLSARYRQLGTRPTRQEDRMHSRLTSAGLSSSFSGSGALMWTSGKSSFSINDICALTSCRTVSK